MKKLILVILLIIVVVLFGTYPLTLFAKLFEHIAKGIHFIADSLNLFGWNGLL